MSLLKVHFVIVTHKRFDLGILHGGSSGKLLLKLKKVQSFFLFHKKRASQNCQDRAQFLFLIHRNMTSKMKEDALIV